jgi:signal peptidase I
MDDRSSNAVVTEPVVDDQWSSESVSRLEISIPGEAPSPPPTPLPPPKGLIRECFEALVITVILAISLTTFIVQAVKVPTGSMQNTINIGDHLLVNKFIVAPGARNYWFLPQREIRRGDVIVFKYPGNAYEPEKDRNRNTIPFETSYVKRVVGLPGDAVEFRGEELWVNGRRLPERIVVAEEPCNSGAPESERCHDAPLKIVSVLRDSGKDPYSAYYEPGSYTGSSEEYPILEHESGGRRVLKVPAQSYFVMGDNRDNSEDSRFWGFVDRDLVIGRALFVYWSYDESADTSGNPLLDFLENTRWSRTGAPIR